MKNYDVGDIGGCLLAAFLVWGCEANAFHAKVRNCSGGDVVASGGGSSWSFPSGSLGAYLPDTNIVWSSSVGSNVWTYSGQVSAMVDLYLSSGGLQVSVREIDSPWDAVRYGFTGGIVMFLAAKMWQVLRRTTSVVCD